MNTFEQTTSSMGNNSITRQKNVRRIRSADEEEDATSSADAESLKNIDGSQPEKKLKTQAESALESRRSTRNRTHFVGLANPDRRCSLNAVIQFLYYMIPIRQQLLSSVQVTFSDWSTTTTALRQVFREISDASTGHIAPKHCIRVGEDAHEHLQYLLSRLTHDIPELLHFVQIKLTPYAPCGYSQGHIDPSGLFMIPLPLDANTMSSAIEASLQSMEQDIVCELCVNNINVSSVISERKFMTLPPFLIFYWQCYSSKDFVPYLRVSITSTLVITESCMSNDTDKALDNRHYSLYGVIIYNGSGKRGHYFAYININNQWHRFDDAVVSSVAFTEVLSKSKMHMPYLLCYQRTQS